MNESKNSFRASQEHSHSHCKDPSVIAVQGMIAVCSGNNTKQINKRLCIFNTTADGI